jgi:hypothetical protein
MFKGLSPARAWLALFSKPAVELHAAHPHATSDPHRWNLAFCHQFVGPAARDPQHLSHLRYLQPLVLPFHHRLSFSLAVPGMLRRPSAAEYRKRTPPPDSGYEEVIRGFGACSAKAARIGPRPPPGEGVRDGHCSVARAAQSVRGDGSLGLHTSGWGRSSGCFAVGVPTPPRSSPPVRLPERLVDLLGLASRVPAEDAPICAYAPTVFCPGTPCMQRGDRGHRRPRHAYLPPETVAERGDYGIERLCTAPDLYEGVQHVDARPPCWTLSRTAIAPPRARACKILHVDFGEFTFHALG